MSDDTSGPLFAQPLDVLLDRSAARTPEIGAGAVAAVAAACAAALATMGARYAGASGVDELAAAGQRLRALADDDGTAFAPLLAAWQLADDVPDRGERVAEAAREACGVPIEICRVAASVAASGLVLVRDGKRDLRGDCAAAVFLADAATQAAAVLVRLNAGRDRAPRPRRRGGVLGRTYGRIGCRGTRRVGLGGLLPHALLTPPRAPSPRTRQGRRTKS